MLLPEMSISTSDASDPKASRGHGVVQAHTAQVEPPDLAIVATTDVVPPVAQVVPSPGTREHLRVVEAGSYIWIAGCRHGVTGGSVPVWWPRHPCRLSLCW